MCGTGASLKLEIRMVINRIVAIILTMALISGCAHQSRSIEDASRRSTVETELGEAINRQILESIPVYHNYDLSAYVESIGRKLAQVSKRKDLSYRFVILEDDRMYATYAPGGYVYITTGFFRFLQSEIELAGILAYEVALLQYKDPRLSRAKKALAFVTQTGSQIGPAFGTIGALSVFGLAILTVATTTPKSLIQRVRAADKRALQYMVASGFDPQGLIDSLGRMMDPESSERAYLYDYLQTHLVTDDRMARLDREFQKLPLFGKQFDAKRNVYLTMTESVRSLSMRR